METKKEKKMSLGLKIEEGLPSKEISMRNT
jgi:hypothetical protein